MGSYEVVDPSRIVPSQDYLKERTVNFILQCLREDKIDELPPAPIVRRHPQKDVLVAIDGHNIIAVRDFRGEKIEVYIADSVSDKLVGEGEAIAARNTDLSEKFEIALGESNRLASLGVATFKDLEAKYPELFEN